MAHAAANSLRVNWQKCNGGHWCTFLDLDLRHPYLAGREGVYVVWYAGPNSHTVYVGSGNIVDRLVAHRGSKWAMRYADSLCVTWAEVPRHQQEGVEAYLAQRLRPTEGRRHPRATPIAATMPW